MRKNRIRLTESQLHKVIKESVKRVLKEMSDDEKTPTSWKEHDDGIATYNRYGKNIGDYTFDAPYYGDSEDSQNRRRESHMAYDFAHNGKDLDNVHNRIAWEGMINDPLHSAHDFAHNDDDATFVRGSSFALGDDDVWNGVNEPQLSSRDKKLERALSSADKRPLHRKGSLNRAMDESIRRAIRKVLC